MTYIAYAWLASVLYALGSVAGKIATNHHIKNPWLYNFMWGFLTILVMTPIALVNHAGLPQDWNSMLWLSLANAVSGTAFILAFYMLDLTALSPLYNIRTGLVVLAGVFLFREVLMPWQWLLMGILLVAGVAINVDERMNIRMFANKRVVFALFAVATSAWFNSYIKVASMHNGYWEIMLWSNVLAVLMTLVTLPLFYRDLRSVRWSKYYGLVASTGFFTAGFLAEVKALAENVSISMAIISLPVSMILVIALSLTWPRLLEKHTAKIYAIRLTAAAVMFAAAFGLSV